MKADYRTTFDDSVRELEQWVDALDKELRYKNKERSFRLLRATLQTLRDGLQTHEVSQLAAGLPLVMKAFFYEGWNPGIIRCTARHDFEDTLSGRLRDDELTDIEFAIRCVFAVLNARLSEGEIDDVRNSLRQSIRDLWPSPRRYD